MTRVLITGASGFIGRACLDALAARDAEVHGVMRSSDRPAPPQVQVHRVDLLDSRQAEALVAKVRPTHLLHLAWVTAPGESWTSKLNVAWVAASLNLLQAFAESGGARVVMAGSCAEYDWSSGGVCLEKATPLTPASLYGTCKNALRSVLDSFAAHVKLSAAWARIFFLYGPHEHPKRLVPSVIRSILDRQPVACTAGTQQRDWLHVSDVGDALVALLFSDVQGAINIGSGRAVAVKDVVMRIADLLGRPDLPRLGDLPIRAGDPPLLTADVTRLQSELRWTLRFELDQGLRETIDWWRRHAAQPT